LVSASVGKPVRRCFAGQLTPVIVRTFPPAAAAAAHRRQEESGLFGATVLEMP
jgi:hypothetical protein